MDHLHRLVVGKLARRAPDLVAAHDLVEAGTDGPDLEPAVLANRDCLVVDGVLGRESAEVPEWLLEHGQRGWAGAHPATQRGGARRSNGATMQPLLQKGALVRRQSLEVGRGHD